jgi:hypothetical protein
MSKTLHFIQAFFHAITLKDINSTGSTAHENVLKIFVLV